MPIPSKEDLILESSDKILEDVSKHSLEAIDLAQRVRVYFTERQTPPSPPMTVADFLPPDWAHIDF